MKKIFFALCTMVLLISCSDDDSAASDNTNGTRLIKAVSTSPESTHTSEYFYNGNQMIKMVSDGSSSYFHYSEGLLTSATNGGMSGTTYEYNEQDKLIYQHYDGGSTRYVYNPDATITATNYEGAELPENIHSISTLYFENGELVKKVMSSPTETDVHTYTFTFDNRNCPNLNKEGYYGAFFFYPWGSYVIGNAHNLLSVTFESTAGPQYTYHYSYEYDYNSYNYPTQQRQLNPEGNPSGAVTNFYYE